MLKQLRDRQWIATAVTRLRELNKDWKPRPRAVYVVQYGELYKIGMSLNPLQRIKAFMLPEVVATIRVYWVHDAPEFERLLHKKYVAHRAHGEWFRLPAATLSEIDLCAEEWKGR